MRLVPLFALLALSAALPAQTKYPASTSATVLLQIRTSNGCPVGLDARHAQDGGLVNVAPAPRTTQQGYRLTFSPQDKRAIAQATVTLHGMSGHHVIPAGENADGDATERFTLSPASTAHHLFRSTVYTEKLTGVQWIELNELIYADGTRWQQSSTSTCRFAPNGYMLVAGD